MSRCLDTSFLIDLARSHPGAEAKARLFDSVGEALLIPAPVLAEYLDGAHHVGGEYLSRAVQLIAGLDVVSLDQATAALAGQLRADLRARGNAMAMVDAMIAAIALHFHHVLVTRDTAFSRIPGLTIESY